MTDPSLWAVIPAAGTGVRMQSAQRKQHLLLHGKTLLDHTLHTLCALERVCGVMVVLAADDNLAAVPTALLDTPIVTTEGGATRAASVRAGVQGVIQQATPSAWVMVHDAARPLVHADDINCLIDTVWQRDAVGGILAVPVQDTLKRAGNAGGIEATVSRDDLWQAQTPQLFNAGMLLAAYDESLHQETGAVREQAVRTSEHATLLVTDEASVMERAGHRPLLIEAMHPNIKITRPADMLVAEAVLHAAKNLQNLAQSLE